MKKIFLYLLNEKNRIHSAQGDEVPKIRGFLLIIRPIGWGGSVILQSKVILQVSNLA